MPAMIRRIEMEIMQARLKFTAHPIDGYALMINSRK